ncbi:hypothetical protein C8J57DRAFT_1254173 [Mycena rebaudengoi]|nr:hypothetical protein C8J57DRAFT_1254173 [Mycena rebaudengoi]
MGLMGTIIAFIHSADVSRCNGLGELCTTSRRNPMGKKKHFECVQLTPFGVNWVAEIQQAESRKKEAGSKARQKKPSEGERRQRRSIQKFHRLDLESYGDEKKVTVKQIWLEPGSNGRLLRVKLWPKYGV